MRHTAFFSFLLLAWAGLSLFADAPTDADLQQLNDPNLHLREAAAVRLGQAIDPDKGVPPPDADAIRAKLGDFYKTHRTEFSHNTREYLSLVLHPDIKRALDETTISDFPIENIQAANLLKGLAIAAKREGAPPFDFSTIRIDLSIPLEKQTIKGPSGFRNATGLEVIRFIAASIGGRYDVDDKGVFIYAKAKPTAPATP